MIQRKNVYTAHVGEYIKGASKNIWPTTANPKQLSMGLFACAFTLLLVLSGCATPSSDDDDFGLILDKIKAKTAEAEQNRKDNNDYGINTINVERSTDDNGLLTTINVSHAKTARVVKKLCAQARVACKLDGVKLTGHTTLTLTQTTFDDALNQVLAPLNLAFSRKRPDLIWIYGNSASIPGEVLSPSFSVVSTAEGTNNQEVVVRHTLESISSTEAMPILNQLYPEDPDTGLRMIRYAEVMESNEIILAGPAQEINKASRLLQHLDVRPRHVFIEAMVIQFKSESLLNLGSRIVDSAKNAFSDINIDFADLTGDTISFTRTGGANNVEVLSVVLNLLLENEDAHIITRPYLTTLSGKTANLAMAEDRYVVSTSPSGDEITLNPISGGVTMAITPVATGGGKIHLDIEVNQSQFISTIENIEQRLSRNSVNNSTIVRDGETVIIGGLMLQSTSRNVAGIPGLRNIFPFSFLFGHRDNDEESNQALIFVTPHLWEPGTEEPVNALGIVSSK